MIDFFKWLKTKKEDEHANIELHNSQYPGSKKKGKQTIRFGLDFGTAFTKVVFNVQPEFYAIPFHEADAENPYLLPSVLYVDEDNICSLTKKNSVTSYSNLKDFIVLGELDELTEDHNKLKAIVIFLALVIQHARKTFMSEHLNQFKNKVLVWDLLIGVPVKNFDDKERMDILQYLLKLAWNASIRSNKIRFNDQELDDEKSDEVELNVQTEVDALLVSLDKQISNDYFIPIDVGAGTTDINFLRVGETSRESSYESKYASLAKSVEPYGSFMMLEDLCKQLDKKNDFNRTENFPSNKEITEKLSLDEPKVKSNIENFIKKYDAQIIDILKTANRDHINNRYERDKVKRKGIKYILLGGGSKIDIYIKTTRKAAERNDPKLTLLKVNKPKQLSPDDLTDDDWSRLIVAYGLAHGVDAFPENMGNAEISYDDGSGSNGSDFRKNYIGPEQM